MAAGVLPDRHRSVARDGRAAARSDARRHGDQRGHGARQEAGKKPRELAEAIAQRLRADELTDKVEVAGPGFINLTLKASAWVAALAEHRAARVRITAKAI